MRGLRDPAHAVEAELYVWTFVVVHQASRSKYDLLSPKPQTAAALAADMRPDFDKCLMNISSVFINTLPGSTHSSRNVVELKLREEAEIRPGMQIEMRHHAAEHVAVMVLRPGAQHPVIVVFVFRAIFQSQRKIILGTGAHADVLDRVEQIRMLRRASNETPVLLGGERVQRRASGIAHFAGRLGIGSLTTHMAGAEQGRQDDQSQPCAGSCQSS